jgi:hypothetical protein
MYTVSSEFLCCLLSSTVFFKIAKRPFELFFLVFYTAILEPTISFESVFQTANSESWIRNRGDAINLSEEYR